MMNSTFDDDTSFSTGTGTGTSAFTVTSTTTPTMAPNSMVSNSSAFDSDHDHHGNTPDIHALDSLLFWGCVAISLQLVRISMDLIQTASQKTSVDYKEDHHKFHNNKGDKPGKTKNNDNNNKNKKDDDGPPKETDALLATSSADTNDNNSNSSISSGSGDESDDDDDDDDDLKMIKQWFFPSQYNKASIWSFRLQAILALALLLTMLFENVSDPNIMGNDGIFIMAMIVFTLGAIMTRRDLARVRFGILSRALLGLATLSLMLPIAHQYYTHRHDTSSADECLWTTVAVYTLLVLVEILFVETTATNSRRRTSSSSRNSSSNIKKKRTLSRSAILVLLKPYFWPDETEETGHWNRIHAIGTWVCVILSKVCNLSSPLFLGWASTALAHQDYSLCIWYSALYSLIQFLGAAFKEGQSLVYLKVAQAAFCQLSETAFIHLHHLSLDWHLQKKLGEVLRSMDRGIAACDTLMKYLFLWLVPGLTECLVVCIIFATYFSYFPLAVAVFYFVWLYIVWTILLTLWRKKFRKAVVQSDNEWHDRCTDSLINFETVKHFTAEEYERQRFATAVATYQQGSVNVQASLAFLNVSQKFILGLCLATALGLSALGIQERVDCCVNVEGCPDAAVSECCRASECPGMQVGDFVAVLTYTIQLFAPLNFLGSVYNAIVMAIIDLTNLSELLAEDPDVVDSPDAIPLPASEDDIAVEFNNVHFHYASQSSKKGLKGVSFQMKRGTTTAIVGPTGAGKTTISRLFFRFYDVLQGSVKVNGQDVRAITQASLRGAIGVVPQTASMFNDTIRANLRYGRRDATQAELEQAAKDAQLLDFIESLDDGWDTMVGDRGLKLSGGEKQRAAIARCLLKDPPFVLLDEATSALDTLTEKSVQEALDRLGSQRTVLVIAHRLGTIRHADNILVLKDGVVAEEGTHEELLEKNGVYAEMWNMQLSSTSDSRASLASGISLDKMAQDKPSTDPSVDAGENKEETKDAAKMPGADAGED